MRLRVVLLIVPLVTCSVENAEGPITPDIETQAWYRWFLKYRHPMVFALSENGKDWAYQYCDEVGACDAATARANALRSCNRSSNGVRCRIYYEYPNGVVWDGPPVVGMDAPATPE